MTRVDRLRWAADALLRALARACLRLAARARPGVDHHDLYFGGDA